MMNTFIRKGYLIGFGTRRTRQLLHTEQVAYFCDGRGHHKAIV